MASSSLQVYRQVSRACPETIRSSCRSISIRCSSLQQGMLYKQRGQQPFCIYMAPWHWPRASSQPAPIAGETISHMSQRVLDADSRLFCKLQRLSSTYSCGKAGVVVRLTVSGNECKQVHNCVAG